MRGAKAKVSHHVFASGREFDVRLGGEGRQDGAANVAARAAHGLTVGGTGGTLCEKTVYLRVWSCWVCNCHIRSAIARVDKGRRLGLVGHSKVNIISLEGGE